MDMTNVSSTADDILSCARSLIIAGGYNGFSYADVAEVVGIRKPSIHHHFASKVDLVRTLVSRYRAEAEAGLAALERNIPDPRDQLKSYVGYWEACVDGCDRSFLRLRATGQRASDPAGGRRAGSPCAFPFARVVADVCHGARKTEGAAASLQHSEGRGSRIRRDVHGAMLSARAYGDPKMFGVITGPLLERLSASTEDIGEMITTSRRQARVRASRCA